MSPEGEFEVVSLNLSLRTGTRKGPVDSVRFVEGRGLDGDAHAGVIENRQVSLLAVEEIEEANLRLAEKLRERARAAGPLAVGEGAAPVRGSAALTSLGPGDFAENITTRGLVLHELPIGTRLEVGGAVLEVSKIGKECHAACEIRTLVGDCVMPRRGIFARVLVGGRRAVLIAVITVSDRASRGEYEDLSGPAIEASLRALCPGIQIERDLVPDELEKIVAALGRHPGADWILTTGGTGPSPRDLTPEATRAYCDRSLPGIADYLRQRSLEETPHAVFSRAEAGMRGRQYVVNFPGSQRAAASCAAWLAPLLDHGVKMAEGGGH